MTNKQRLFLSAPQQPKNATTNAINPVNTNAHAKNCSNAKLNLGVENNRNKLERSSSTKK
ncbi:hypothetical protein BLOT_005763 [Blomia tropicalis]|nr:hypothetical protein BLOT_005763 [Blomia tropicalis]